MISAISLIVLVAMSGFFSASETAFSSVNPRKLKILKSEGNKKASMAGFLSKNFDMTLSTILLGNNLVNIGASALMTVVIYNLFGEGAVFIGSLVMIVIILIVGEIIPKLVANAYNLKVVLIFSYPLFVLYTILTPFNILINLVVKSAKSIWTRESEESEATVTGEEIALLIDKQEDEGLIDNDRSELLHSVLEFSDIMAQEILTPRVDMTAIDLENDFETIKNTIVNSRHTRIPVYSKNIDDIKGIIHSMAFLVEYASRGEFDIREILTQPAIVYQTTSLPQVFKKLNSKRVHMALVIDEYGGTMGIVTMEDVLEELVGDIWDENDIVELEFEEVDGKVIVDGDVTIRDFADYFEFDYEEIDSDYTTVGGWALEMLNDEAKLGENFDFENINIGVNEMDGYIIEKLIIRRINEEENDV